jgi:hypothetical protein
MDASSSTERPAQAPRKAAGYEGRMATTETFPAWLREQEYRGDEIGEFAKEASRLTDLPDSGGKAIYDGYFETALEGQQATYERAWTEFSASPEPSKE